MEKDEGGERISSATSRKVDDNTENNDGKDMLASMPGRR